MTRAEELEKIIVRLDGQIYQLQTELAYKNKVLRNLEDEIRILERRAKAYEKVIGV